MNKVSELPGDALVRIRSYLQSLQSNIVRTLESIDNETFHHDLWSRNEGGGGRSCVLEGGTIFEKAGVNFSHIIGEELPKASLVNRPSLVSGPFHALGVSLVIHPNNPYIPTAHANIRFFMATPENAAPYWWFGGGFDLTPYYGFKEDCIHWHETAKAACEPFGSTLYPQFKAQCDEYFYLKHRQEARGVGGIFFDEFNAVNFEHSFQFAQSIGNCFLKAYLPIIQKRKHLTFTDQEKNFQLYRRGRYVEFNLIYDRGTLFGLQSNGRTESILISMPPQVKWAYNWIPKPGSAEENLYSEFLVPKDWV